MQLEKPKHLVSLGSSAMLVTVTNSIYTGISTDSDASNEVVLAKGAAQGAAKVVKDTLMSCGSKKRLDRFMRGTINNGVRRFTYDWAGSLRILPMTHYAEFEKWWADCEVEFAKLLSEFKAEYPNYVANIAFASQGQLFNRADYPDVSEFDRKYVLERVFIPVPENDFRVSIAQDAVDNAHAHYCKAAQRWADNVVSDQTNRFVEVMRRIHHSCGFNETTDKNGEVKVTRRKLIRETYEKALDMIDSFKQFNITNDTQLEELRGELERVLQGKTFEQI